MRQICGNSWSTFGDSAHDLHLNDQAPKDCIFPAPRTASAAIEKLASIHDGKKGQSIPNEVMAFYRAVNSGDRFRPAMLRIIVPTLRSSMRKGLAKRDKLLSIVHRKLAAAADRLPLQRLEDWLAADQRRNAYVPTLALDRASALREGYVSEALQIAIDVLDYAEALCA